MSVLHSSVERNNEKVAEVLPKEQSETLDIPTISPTSNDSTLVIEISPDPPCQPKLEFYHRYKTSKKKVKTWRIDREGKRIQDDPSNHQESEFDPTLISNTSNEIITTNKNTVEIVSKDKNTVEIVATDKNTVDIDIDQFVESMESKIFPVASKQVQVVKKQYGNTYVTSIYTGRPTNLIPYDPSISKTFDEEISLDIEMKRKAKKLERMKRKQDHLLNDQTKKSLKSMQVEVEKNSNTPKVDL